MKLTVVQTAPAQYKSDLTVYFVRQGAKKKAPSCPDKQVSAMLARAFATGDFSGKEGQTFMYYPDGSGKMGAARVLVVGLGKDGIERETVRKAAGSAAGCALKTKAAKLLLVVPELDKLNIAEVGECLAEGVILGSYQFLKYKTKKKGDDKPALINSISFYGGKAQAALRRGIKQGQVAAEAACVARDMAHEPGNFWTPNHFAEYGKQLAKEHGLRCKVLDKPAIKRLKMGGVLGVNQGSDQHPCVVILEYRTGKKVPTLLLVGKGLTFDSGGISLKTSAGMGDMKYDMCGGAAVLAAMAAVGEEKPKGLDVVAIVPTTENMPGPAAIKPGDIITQYGGKTVEVLNTDAEGRLILADALAYGIEKYKPKAVVDLATLTGAVIVGLGHHRSGLLSNDEKLVKKIIAAGERSAEPVWQLPLAPEYSKQMESTVADLKNVDKGAAGTITAAAFLQEFVGKTPWAHLDIAGTAWDFTDKSYVPKGPSGIGVRLLVDLIRNWR